MKWIGIILFLVSLSLKAQTDSVLRQTLPIFDVFDSVYNQPNSDNIRLLNANNQIFYAHKNLSDLIGDKTGFFIKNYGIGSLATTSSRGSASVHTAIVWNGVAINSPMNGLLDLNLIPVALMQSINLTEGNRTAQYGSGSIGATILLENRMEFKPKVEINFQPYMASFENKGYNVSTILSNKNIYFSIAFLQRKAQNNFEYINYTKRNSPTEKLSNAAYSNQGLMSEIGYKINAKNTISAKVWSQNADRELPPTLIQNSNVAKQIDAALRIGIFHVYQYKKLKFENSITHIFESINYQDKAANLDEENTSKNTIFQTLISYQIHKNWLSKSGINYNTIQSKTDGYGQKISQNRYTIYSGIEGNNNKNKLFGALYLRKEKIDKNEIPLIVNAKVRIGKIAKNHVEANIGSVYRYPNLNDLYWNPGGNPNLKPESGYSTDMSFISQKFATPKKTFQFQQTIFHQIIDGWILWLPGQNGIYTPMNVQQVWARGSETKITYTFKHAKNYFQWNNTFNYTLSTITKKRFEGDNAVDKQLIYVPPITASSALTHQYKKLSQKIQFQYISYRYTSIDNEEFLDGYYLLNYQINYQLKFKKVQSTLSFEINNITNNSYEIITYRPMPGRNYNLSLFMKINQKK